MPRAPHLVGKLAETLIGRRARLLATEQISADFLELHFAADPPPGGWQPGHEIQVRATPTQGRRYTVRTIESPDHISVLTLLHGEGPGTRWLRSLGPGTETNLLAGRHVPLKVSGSRRLFIGDGSALGTLDAYASSAPNSHASTVVVEVPQRAAASLRSRWTKHHFLPALPDQPGVAIDSWLNQTLRLGSLNDVNSALLLGHAQSIQRQRKALVATGLLEKRAIVTRPYWSTGKTGL